MTALRIAFALGGIALAAAIIWAFGASSFRDGFGRVTAEPWGIVTLCDLYLGFLAMAAIIVATERRRAVAIVLIVTLFVLGNVVTAMWLVWRAPRIAARLGASG